MYDACEAKKLDPEKQEEIEKDIGHILGAGRH
jgi:hypothetical protein